MLVEQIAEIRRNHPDNLMARYFDAAYFKTLSAADQERLSRMILTGVRNPDSIMGAYALYPDDYERFQPYLDLMIRDYHNIQGDLQQHTDWDCGDEVDLTRIDASLADCSMRVRVGRNLNNFPLPGAMSKTDRVSLENQMVKAFAKLIENPAFGGHYSSLTPGAAQQISQQEYQQLVADHKMFEDMSDDPYLSVARISADWPYGRGMYESADGQFIVWVGEEDHLRIMAMKRGALLNEIFVRLNESLGMLERQGLNFARSATYGYVTSCPTNLGTGMRASLHLALPKMTQNGRDLAALKALVKNLGLSVRGVGGEHTSAGAGGLVDISPRARLQVTEAEICRQLYAGVKALWEKEQQALS
jgi:creatine kinase